MATYGLANFPALLVTGCEAYISTLHYLVFYEQLVTFVIACTFRLIKPVVRLGPICDYHEGEHTGLCTVRKRSLYRTIIGLTQSDKHKGEEATP